MLRRAAAPKRGAFDQLLAAVFARARALGLIDRRPEAVIDSTGMEARHVSAYFARRSRPHTIWPKVTAVSHVGSYLVSAAVVTRGPSNDIPEFPPALRQATSHLRPKALLADKAYDVERLHRLCHEELGIGVTVIPINRRNRGRKWPLTPYRRALRHRFPRRQYGRRWHVESVFSALKRVLGSALRARSDASLDRECLWRVLAYDLMILRRVPGFQRSKPGSELLSVPAPVPRCDQ